MLTREIYEAISNYEKFIFWKKRNEKNSKDDNTSNVMYGVKHVDLKTGKNSKVDVRASSLHS